MKIDVRKAIMLMVEDDDDDFSLAKDAMESLRLSDNLYRAKNGEELIQYLEGSGIYRNRTEYPLPNIIFLDLNMPKMDGRQALAKIQERSLHTEIPIVVMTTSQGEKDIFETYRLGANSFVRKPVSFAGLVKVMKEIGTYWFDVVDLPHASGSLDK